MRTRNLGVFLQGSINVVVLWYLQSGGLCVGECIKEYYNEVCLAVLVMTPFWSFLVIKPFEREENVCYCYRTVYCYYFSNIAFIVDPRGLPTCNHGQVYASSSYLVVRFLRVYSLHCSWAVWIMLRAPYCVRTYCKMFKWIDSHHHYLFPGNLPGTHSQQHCVHFVGVWYSWVSRHVHRITEERQSSYIIALYKCNFLSDKLIHGKLYVQKIFPGSNAKLL